jgi:hypothetical protein
MPEYRVVELDVLGKIVGPSKRFVCNDDEAAVQEVRKILNGVIEIWDGPRRVAPLDPNDDKPHV